MFGRKKNQEALRALISETAYRVAVEALEEVVELADVEDGKANPKMTIEAIKQKAQITLTFIENLSEDNEESEEEPAKRVKEYKPYGKR